MIKDANMRTSIVVDREVFRRFKKHLAAQAKTVSGWIRLKIEEELERE